MDLAGIIPELVCNLPNLEIFQDFDVKDFDPKIWLSQKRVEGTAADFAYDPVSKLKTLWVWESNGHLLNSRTGVLNNPSRGRPYRK